MNFLKKTFAAALIGATLATPIAALADHDATPFTEDEKKTLSTIVEFENCASTKIHAIPTKEMQNAADDFIQKNGGAVTNEEFANFMTQTFVIPAQDECFRELGIDVQEMRKKVTDLIKTHGEDVGSRTKAPAPKP